MRRTDPPLALARKSLSSCVTTSARNMAGQQSLPPAKHCSRWFERQKRTGRELHSTGPQIFSPARRRSRCLTGPHWAGPTHPHHIGSWRKTLTCKPHYHISESYKTKESSSLLEIIDSPFELKSKQLILSEFSRNTLATLKLRSTLSVSFIVASVSEGTQALW
ncbi:hypothetical protein EYF80_005869 [Liparis tanakae]|uniref:Uncharacterized protein n=1 Tax=Liparis tanakae TaxID=230148 RepID=A0A4Z2J2R1_9TELE|nr:hypothetical protein EYF80_005869 [Liparis tanakae]